MRVLRGQRLLKSWWYGGMVVWWYGAHIDRCHIALLYNIYIDAIRTRYGVSDAATQPRANSSDSTPLPPIHTQWQAGPHAGKRQWCPCAARVMPVNAHKGTLPCG